MIDSLITRPFLVLATFLKRHWPVVLVIFLLLWLAPPFYLAVGKMWDAAANVLGRLAELFRVPGEYIDRFRDKRKEVTMKLAERPSYVWLAVGALFVPKPKLAGLIAAWMLADTVKLPPAPIDPLEGPPGPPAPLPTLPRS